MTRQSARKVKHTSKFEEFNTTRLASIHNRQSHNEASNETSHEEAPTQPVANAAVAIASPQTPQTPQTPVPTPRLGSRSALKQAIVKQSATRNVSVKVENTTPPSNNLHSTPMPKLTANGKIRGRPRKCWTKADTVVKVVPTTREELNRLREENANLKIQLEQKTAEFDELQRQSSYTGQTVPKIDYDDLKANATRELDYAKRHEWCVMCLTPSRYYCCWNTTYCSQKCQVTDWYDRHNKLCQRKRALQSNPNQAI